MRNVDVVGDLILLFEAISQRRNLRADVSGAAGIVIDVNQRQSAFCQAGKPVLRTEILVQFDITDATTVQLKSALV